MKIKFSATFEGKCSICKKKGTVFNAGDEDTKKTVTVCRDCANQLGSAQVSDVIEKYGKEDRESFNTGIKFAK